jgi:adenylate kinase family enzyme
MTRVDTVIGIAGHARSGKSALAGRLARQSGGLVVGFGDLVRQAALARGQDPSDRSTLVTLGQEWVEHDPAGICRAALSQVSERCDVVIFDGIRHVAVFDELKHLFPSMVLVYLQAPDELISERLAGSFDPRRHPNELDMALLAQRSEAVLDARCNVSDLAEQIWRIVARPERESAEIDE